MAGEKFIALEETSQEIKATIGETTDTGGSTTTGSTMSKLNKALELVSKLGIDENGIYVITD